MSHKNFMNHLKNFKQPKTVSQIAAGKNVSSVRFQDEPKGISPHEYAKTPEGIKMAEKFMKDKGFKWDKDTENIVPIPKAKGGYVKKYANGGGVRKVRT